ncbi:MAG: DUF4058 family protein [Acidobacteria bacterium]|nr:DUF4058 family protein [Acidobacteriota bacterium]
MALLDHFHPPLKGHRHWHSFHNAWATHIALDLNQHLPEGWFAEPNVQFGIEIDVATLEAPATTASLLHLQTVQGGVSAVPQRIWTPPQPAKTVPFAPVTDTIEVNIFETSGGPTLIGAIELVSPANKDRAEHRQAFVSKCETYLRQGIGLVVVDIVTERRANLHDELMGRLRTTAEPVAPSHFYASAYRVVERDKQPCLDIWQESLSVGHPLPTLPLWLRGNWCLPVELNDTYEHTCRGLKISPVA